MLKILAKFQLAKCAPFSKMRNILDIEHSIFTLKKQLDGGLNQTFKIQKDIEFFV